MDNGSLYLMADISIKGVSYVLATVYGSNKDDPEFYVKFFEHMSNELNKLIIAGDWSVHIL